MDLREIGWKDVERSLLTQDRDKWQTHVNAVMKFGFHKRWGIS